MKIITAIYLSLKPSNWFDNWFDILPFTNFQRLEILFVNISKRQSQLHNEDNPKPLAFPVSRHNIWFLVVDNLKSVNIER